MIAQDVANMLLDAKELTPDQLLQHMPTMFDHFRFEKVDAQHLKVLVFEDGTYTHIGSLKIDAEYYKVFTVVVDGQDTWTGSLDWHLSKQDAAKDLYSLYQRVNHLNENELTPDELVKSSPPIFDHFQYWTTPSGKIGVTIIKNGVPNTLGALEKNEALGSYRPYIIATSRKVIHAELGDWFLTKKEAAEALYVQYKRVHHIREDLNPEDVARQAMLHLRTWMWNNVQKVSVVVNGVQVQLGFVILKDNGKYVGNYGTTSLLFSQLGHLPEFDTAQQAANNLLQTYLSKHE